MSPRSLERKRKEKAMVTRDSGEIGEQNPPNLVIVLCFKFIGSNYLYSEYQLVCTWLQGKNLSTQIKMI
jgi:hypothetical protein